MLNYKKMILYTHSFLLRDTITLNGETYEITGLLPGREIQVSELSSTKLLKLSPQDDLYKALLKEKTENLNTQKFKSFKR